MCDYSLMAIPNRLAVSGEDLVVHRFAEGSNGLASPHDLQKREDSRKAQSHAFWARIKEFLSPADGPPIPAVCIPPGARLLVQDIPARLQNECGLEKKTQEAVFTQLTASVNAFRDAVRFGNGVEVLLQKFAVGQRVRVLDCASAEDDETASIGQHRVLVTRK